MAVETMVQPPRTMLEVFESLPEGTHVQIIQNTLVMSPSPIDLHQWIVGEVFGEIRSYLKKMKIGTVRVSPSDVFLNAYNVYQSDMYVVLNDNLNRFKNNGFYGPPDLVVEVLSPSTAQYDLHDKKEMYERFGVKEYWIIEPDEYVANGYYLVNDQYHEFFKGKGYLESKLLGVKIEF